MEQFYWIFHKKCSSLNYDNFVYLQFESMQLDDE